MLAVANNNLATKSVVIQMLSPEEQRLVDLLVQVLVSTTLKQLYEQKRNTLSQVQQQGTE